MTPLSPTRAVSEGFRLIGREPKAVAVWAVLWLATYSAAAWAVAAGKAVAAPGPHGSVGVADLSGRFGPFGLPLIALFLLMWLVTAVAAFRAVLRPEDRRWFYLRLGADEIRLGLLSLAAFLIALAAGGIPTYLVFVIASPIMNAAPAAARDIAFVGALVTVWIDVWLGVRLSLIAVETVAERRFHLTAYWPVTRGRFWYLISCYFLFFVLFLGLSMAFAAAGALIYEVAAAMAGAGDIVGRGGILLLAGALAVLTAAFSTVSWTVFCACQAFALRAIVGDGRDGVKLN